VGQLGVEFLGVQTGYQRGERPAPRPGTAATSAIELNEGEWTFLRIVNRFSRILNLVVLNLKTGWGITQIYPSQNKGSFLPLDPGKEIVLPIRGDLPVGLDEAGDLLKVFAMIGTTDSHWLELPSLRGPEPASGGTTGRETPAAVARSSVAPASAPAPAAVVKRGIIPSEFPSEEWVTAEVKMQVRRAERPAEVVRPTSAPPASSAGGRSWNPSV
jgi:hypothetical protein